MPREETTVEKDSRRAQCAGENQMKHRGLLILGWFFVLLVYNVASHWSQNEDYTALYIFLEAVGRITGPAELALSAVVVSGIAFSKRKPMGER